MMRALLSLGAVETRLLVLDREDDPLDAHIDRPDAPPVAGSRALGRVLEIEHVLASASSSTVAGAIPDKFVVLGITARVITAITGTGGGWSLGVPADTGRYGVGLGVTQNAYAHGVTGQPQTYYGGTDLVLSAGSSAFTGGAVRLAIHGWSIEPPLMV